MKHLLLSAFGLLLLGSLSLQAQEPAEDARDFSMGRLVLDNGGTGDNLFTLIMGLNVESEESVEWIFPGYVPDEPNQQFPPVEVVLAVSDVNDNEVTLEWVEIETFGGGAISPEGGPQLDRLMQVIETQQAQIDALQARLDALEAGTMPELTVEAEDVIEAPAGM